MSITIQDFARAASFDCNKAKSLVEYTICSNSELSSLDDQLAVRYEEAIRATKDKESLEIDQRKWLLTRDSCNNIECLKESYANRISELERSGTQTQGEERIAGSETIPVDQRFLGRYIGTAENITQHAHGRMSIDIEQGDKSGYVKLRMKAWDGLGGEGVFNEVEISADGHLKASGTFSDFPFGSIPVFRPPRFWDCDITGVIRDNRFQGSYSLFPQTVGRVGCAPLPGYPCEATDKSEGKFDLEKHAPLVPPR